MISPTPTATADADGDAHRSFDSADAPPAAGQPSGDPIAAPVAQPQPGRDARPQTAAAKKKAKPKMIRPYPTVRISGQR